MSIINKVEFECCECKSNQLAYQKYVKCLTPVSLQENGHIEYGPSSYDEDDYLAVSNGFLCADCGHMVEHCGCHFEAEKDLLDYLATCSLSHAPNSCYP